MLAIYALLAVAKENDSNCVVRISLTLKLTWTTRQQWLLKHVLLPAKVLAMANFAIKDTNKINEKLK